MPHPARRDHGDGNRHRGARIAAHGVFFASLWAILTGNRGWSVGLPAVLLATWVSCLATAAPRWSLTALAAFVPYFIVNSLRGGIDVARRAVDPALSIAPAIVRLELGLQTAGARVLMANVVTLLPGTLSADLDDATLSVHVLNAADDHLAMLRDLERRIRSICEPAGKGAVA